MSAPVHRLFAYLRLDNLEALEHQGCGCLNAVTSLFNLKLKTVIAGFQNKLAERQVHKNYHLKS
jgi:hypothetical protein